MGGLCCGEGTTTTTIDNEINNATRVERQVQKLLLLGSGSSGKSTLFKQLKEIHKIRAKDDSEETKKNVRKNLVVFMLKLLTKSAEFVDQGLLECHVDLSNDEIASAVHLIASYKQQTFEDDSRFTAEQFDKLGKAMTLLWQLPSLNYHTFSRRNFFSIADNMDYFFDKCCVMFRIDYEPDFEDILRCRVRTTGMTCIEYSYEKLTFTIFDVGGQRNERRKWFNYFDEVTAIVFVAALNAYYSVIFEDENKNAMHESLDVFGEICNHAVFDTTDVILLLNKNDLFEENIRNGVSLSHCFSKERGWEGIIWEGPDYQPPTDTENEKEETEAKHNADYNNATTITPPTPIDALAQPPNNTNFNEKRNSAVLVKINHSLNNPSSDDGHPMLTAVQELEQNPQHTHPKNNSTLQSNSNSDSKTNDNHGSIEIETLNNEMIDLDEEEQIYNGCYLSAMQFIRRAYKLQLQSKRKKVFIHTTTATDQDVIKKVFYDVQSMIVRQNLTRSGLVHP